MNSHTWTVTLFLLLSLILGILIGFTLGFSSAKGLYRQETRIGYTFNQTVAAFGGKSPVVLSKEEI